MTHQKNMPEKKRCCEIWKKPKVPIVIEGFPGFGLVSTIATGFLVDHLQCEQIGRYWFDETQPTLAIHACKLIDPIGVYYNKKYNVVIVHSISPIPAGMEWKATEIVIEVAKLVGAKKIITSEGVGSPEADNPQGFFYATNDADKKKFEKLGIQCLGEGIIVGITSSILLRAPQEKIDVCSLFAETHSKLPDSKAAAKIIELLDKYLGMKVDYKPLLKQAAEFEKKIRNVIEKTNETQQIKEKKQISYVG
ncbi:hypothetical protein COV18_00540 [Candidatus Woesearchaeota archaeon CG10_big_fil_rev_8_21_14_0_10_37_12]|nr:MAG: hypothetical protein COV18_00540 [Candidatus Woesearchaeota archaeon CG10_big_fil_rev_8_21_14_0_10_37_12]